MKVFMGKTLRGLGTLLLMREAPKKRNEGSNNNSHQVVAWISGSSRCRQSRSRWVTVRSYRGTAAITRTIKGLNIGGFMLGNIARGLHRLLRVKE